MKMSMPVPFDKDLLDNSPLKPDGSDWPCKTCQYKISAMNKIPVNEPALLQLDGSAIHGGGTCQIAISLDEKANAQSTFKVIQTYQGDCPPKAGTGLTFSLPKELPSGRATFAWSWFNQIGNREMYLNLAPIEITGGSNDQSYFDSLPDLMVANVPATDCTTKESTDPTIPNAGKFSISSNDVKPGDFSGPKCAAGGLDVKNAQQTEKNFAAYGPPATNAIEVIPMDGSSGGSSGGSGATPSAPAAGGNNGQYNPTPPSATAVAPSAPASPPAPTMSAPVAPPSTFSTYTVPATTSAAASAYPTLSPSPNQGVGGPAPSAPVPSGAPSSGDSCPTDGALVCNGFDKFAVCNHGKAVWQSVAAGTTCSYGAISKRSTHFRRGAHKVRAA